MNKLLIIGFSVVLITSLIESSSPNSFAEEPNEFQQMEELNHRGIWDGNFTRARSGLGWELPDSGSSEGKSGVKKTFRNYYIVPHEELNRMYDEVERDEISNVGKIRDYSTEAILQFPQSMTFNGHTVPVGYYLAYLGDGYSGSQEINMGHSEEWVPVALQNQRAKGELKEYSAIILKRQGRVLAAFPIDRREPYHRKKGEPKAKRAFGGIEMGQGGPKLKIYYKEWIYIVDTGPTRRPVKYPPVTQGLQPIKGGAPSKHQELPPLRP